MNDERTEVGSHCSHSYFCFVFRKRQLEDFDSTAGIEFEFGLDSSIAMGKSQGLKYFSI